MIQLASDPNASRTPWRPVPSEVKAAGLESAPGRSGHAWPFISRHADKPAAQQPPRNPSDSGS